MTHLHTIAKQAAAVAAVAVVSMSVKRGSELPIITGQDAYDGVIVPVVTACDSWWKPLAKQPVPVMSTAAKGLYRFVVTAADRSGNTATEKLELTVR